MTKTNNNNNSENNEKMIKRIEKLLSLSNNNSNEEESYSAMLKAQELMAKHNISVDSVGEKVDVEVDDVQITEHKRTSWYIKSLATVVANNFKCQAYISKGSGKTSMNLIGKKEDVEIAKEVFEFAVNSLEYNVTVFSIGKKVSAGEKNDYRRGYIQGLDAKFKEQVEKEGWGLMIVKDEEVLDYIKNMNLRKGTRQNISTGGSSEAFNNGYDTGKNFSQIRKQVEA